MTTLEIPQFSNTCGKIFADKIILATSHTEREVALKDIKKVRFTTRPQAKSLFFVALPAILFVFPFYTTDQDSFIKVVFVALGIGLMAISIWQVNKKHTLTVKLATGRNIGLNVWQGNVKEAKKFAGMVNAKVARRA
jgi:hypothetical protein